MSKKYGCSIMVGRNGTAKYETDEHGYYRVLLGALNYFNRSGIWYGLNESAAKFESSGKFMRQVSEGTNYGERNHPPQGSMTEEEWINRIRDINMDNVAFHLREVELVPGKTPNANGTTPVYIWGWICPHGPHGADLKAGLDNPHINVCFSIRTLMHEYWKGGVRCRDIEEVICFDWVMEGGIDVANKFKQVGLEGIDLEVVELTAENVSGALEIAKERSLVAGFENSADFSDLERVAKELNRGIVKINPLLASGWSACQK